MKLPLAVLAAIVARQILSDQRRGVCPVVRAVLRDQHVPTRQVISISTETVKVSGILGGFASRQRGLLGKTLVTNSGAGSPKCPTGLELLRFSLGNKTLPRAKVTTIRTHLMRCRTCWSQMPLTVDAFEDMMRAITARLPGSAGD